METSKDLEQEGNQLGAAVFTDLTISIAKYRRCCSKVGLRGQSYRSMRKGKEGGKKNKLLKSSGIVVSPKFCKVEENFFS